MRLAEQETERLRRKMGMSRRQFVRTSAAFGVGLWAINQLRWGHAAASAGPGACDLDNPGVQLQNLPGELVFNIQSHHVDANGRWRLNNPAFEAFFAAVWPQAGASGGLPGRYPAGSPRGFGHGGEVDPIASLARFHYIKELYLDSSTDVCVLSAVPSSPDNQPLPIEEAAQTALMVNELAGGTPRCIIHAFVMPNRGAYGTNQLPTTPRPLYMGEEFETMERLAAKYGPRGSNILRGWKTYCPWGDVPNVSGWMLTDRVGEEFIEQVRHVHRTTGAPALIATHKGFALPGFDQRASSPADIGPAASQNPDVTFIVYHSGYDIGDTQGPYPTPNPVTLRAGRRRAHQEPDRPALGRAPLQRRQRPERVRRTRLGLVQRDDRSAAGSPSPREVAAMGWAKAGRVGH